MKLLTLTPELAEVARRVIWFEPPEQAIANPVRFLAYAMTYGNHSDMKVIRQQLSTSDCAKQSPMPRQASPTRVPGPIGISN
jgi:hypothetical protein